MATRTYTGSAIMSTIFDGTNTDGALTGSTCVWSGSTKAQ